MSVGRIQVGPRVMCDAFPQIEGVVYCSSMNDNQPCMALFEGQPPHCRRFRRATTH